MQCPTCKDSPLRLAARQEVSLKFCAQCRGIWLERGQLDMIVTRSAAEFSEMSLESETSHSHEAHLNNKYEKKAASCYPFYHKKT